MEPTVTVLMPVYNGTDFLEESINSILEQSFGDFEFLILDDASTDGSVDIIRGYSDPRIRLIENNENMGQVATMNRGIGLADGEFIARMDQDDISLPERLEKQVSFMDANPDVAVCGTWAETFGSVSQIWKYPLTHEEITCWLLFGSVLVHPSVIIRRGAVAGVTNIYDEGFSKAEDYYLWVKLSQKVRFANIGEVLIRYRVHEESLLGEHKIIQREAADRVRKILLDTLGLNVSEAEMELHSAISQWKFQDKRDFLDRVDKWLMRIAQANVNAGIYDHEVLMRVLAERLWSACNSATSEGFSVWRTFHSSKLSRYMDVDWEMRLRFLAKCAVRYRQAG